MTRSDYREVTISGGRVISIPKLDATEGSSYGDYNFSGPGWNSTQGAMAARPVCTFDFASKLHDLSYCISKIEDFKSVSDHDADIANNTGDPVMRSVQHKADLLFRIMVVHTDNSGVGPLYSRLTFAHDRADYAMANDGFVNILNEPSLIAVLNDYRMMPWDQLPGDNQVRHRRDWFERNVHGPRNYAERVPQDSEWYDWARTHYAPVWGQLRSII